jgi:hypothetical protein
MPARRPSPETPNGAGGYRGWAELLARTFGVDLLACPKCQGRLKLMAMVTDPASIARCLTVVGEATEVPRRTPSRGPPYWKSQVLRRRATGDEDGCGNHRGGQDEAREAGGQGAVGRGSGALCAGNAKSHRRLLPRCKEG